MNRVLIQKPHIRLGWCQRAIDFPEFTERQADGRIRHWIYIEELGKYLRVVTLEDGLTLHNAFPDRNFKPE